MANHRVRQGLDIPIAGAATGGVEQLTMPASVALDPRELGGFIPRLAARAGDQVLRGQPLLFHKFDPKVQWVSPVSGTVREVRRGARRVITDLIVDVDGDGAVEHRAWELSAIASISRDDAREQMLATGLWPLLRTRPLDVVPDPSEVPQSILIGGMETGPLQPGADILLSVDDKDALQAAVHVLGALTDGPVFLAHAEGEPHPALSGLSGVQAHTFSGKHPVGHPPVQVNHVDPPRGMRKVFWLTAWDAVAIGRSFLSGAFDATRIYAAVGKGVVKPRFVRTVLGAPVADIVGAVHGDENRWIRGSVLTGSTISSESWAGFYARAIHVLPTHVDAELIGWALPQLGRWSAYRAFLKGWGKPSDTFDLRPGLWGGKRAIVPTGHHRTVIATPDIVPTYLFKSIISGDLETSIKLGLLDITTEEAALCSYICASKIDYDLILREGLALYAKEA